MPKILRACNIYLADELTTGVIPEIENTVLKGTLESRNVTNFIL